MKKYYVIAALAAMFLVACNKETTLSNVPEAEQEIAIRTLGIDTKSAINSTAFPEGYDMLVSAYKNVGTHKGEDVSADYFEGIQFAKNETTWKSIKGPKYYPIDGTLDFLAVASAGIKDPSKGIVPTCVWGESSNVAKKVVLTVLDNSVKFDDLLFASANAQGSSASGTAMTFNHAMSSVVFVASSNVAYNAESNVGITINSITVDGAKYSGTLTVSNPAAGGSTGDLSAVWSGLGSAQTHVNARVWAAANTGVKTDEPALSGLHLTTTPAPLTGDGAKPFGEAYVILPEQAAVPFTINYTVHNGKNASGTAPQNNTVEYQYTPASGTWQMGKKYVYNITITLTEIQIVPTVVDWANQTPVDVQLP